MGICASADSGDEDSLINEEAAAAFIALVPDFQDSLQEFTAADGARALALEVATKTVWKKTAKEHVPALYSYAQVPSR